ncbi:MAG: LemA family protein [Terriglobales bacterium]
MSKTVILGGNGRPAGQKGAARPWLIVLIVVVLVIVVSAASYTSRWNHMVVLRETVKQQWSQVDVVIRRRADLIPNLVNTVKGFAAQERTVIGEVTSARAALGGARTPKDELAANDRLQGALSRLLVIVENYPQLRSNQNFLALQDELTGTENRIAVERRRYNQAIQAYNTYIQTFPNNMVAHFGGMSYDANYFEAPAQERTAPPVVDFSH